MIIFNQVRYQGWNLTRRIEQAQAEANAAWQTVMQLERDHLTTRGLLYACLVLSSLGVILGGLALLMR
jgi:hypothetical protein